MPRTTITQKRYSFIEALNQVPHGEIKQAREEITKILGLSSLSQLYDYLKGKRIPTLSQAVEVQRYFNQKYGIPENEVWKEII